MTSEECEALLLELAAHPDGVADALRILGIEGRRGSCLACPVAEYLRMHGAKDIRVSVGVYVRDAWVGREAVPREIIDFMNAFDRGNYPDLVAQP